MKPPDCLTDISCAFCQTGKTPKSGTTKRESLHYPPSPKLPSFGSLSVLMLCSSPFALSSLLFKKLPSSLRSLQMLATTQCRRGRKKIFSSLSSPSLSSLFRTKRNSLASSSPSPGPHVSLPSPSSPSSPPDTLTKTDRRTSNGGARSRPRYSSYYQKDRLAFPCLSPAGGLVLHFPSSPRTFSSGQLLLVQPGGQACVSCGWKPDGAGLTSLSLRVFPRNQREFSSRPPSSSALHSRPSSSSSSSSASPAFVKRGEAEIQLLQKKRKRERGERGLGGGGKQGGRGEQGRCAYLEGGEEEEDGKREQRKVEKTSRRGGGFLDELLETAGVLLSKQKKKVEQDFLYSPSLLMGRETEATPSSSSSPRAKEEVFLSRFQTAVQPGTGCMYTDTYVCENARIHVPPCGPSCLEVSLLVGKGAERIGNFLPCETHKTSPPLLADWARADVSRHQAFLPTCSKAPISARRQKRAQHPTRHAWGPVRVPILE